MNWRLLLVIFVISVQTVELTKFEVNYVERWFEEVEEEPEVIPEEEENEEEYHLPLNVLPEKYKITLNIDTSLWNFHGEETVDIAVISTTSSIQFNAKNLDIQWSDIILRDSVDLVEYSPSNYTYSDETEIATVTFEQEISPKNYQLVIKFIGIIRSDVFGLYRSEYTIDNQQKYVVATQFQAAYARNVFPCWDNTNFRSIFEIELNHADQYEAYSNMKVAARTSLEQNRILTRFDPSPPMATYLLAFVLAEYKTIQSEDGFLGVHVPTNVPETAVQYFLSNIRDALDRFEEFLGHPYQLPKLDFISIPRMYFGGMEHWGLITAVSRYFLNIPGSIPASSHQSMTTIITHELAHMWFGNEVTPESWNYLWLSEGMASYFELFIGNRMHPTWRLMDQYLLIHVHNAMRQDDKLSARSMTGSFYKAQEYNGQFDYIPYAKSGSVVRMIQNMLGLQNFRDVLNIYITSRSFNTTNPDYFHARIQDIIDRGADIPLPQDVSMATVIRSWTDNPGYPVIFVTRTTGGISLSQRRFLSDWQHTAVIPSQFYVPINVKTASNHHIIGTLPMAWLVPGEELRLDGILPTEYVIVNRQQTGYYRVNYADSDWKFLSDVLDNPQLLEDIHILNRAQLIDDSANLAKAGHARYDAFFGIIFYLKNEVDYIPWTAATNNILPLEVMLRGIEEYPRFSHLINSLTGKVYPTIKLTEYEDAEHLESLHTQTTGNLACYFGNPECLQDAATLVNGMLDDSQLEGIPVQIQPTVFCAVAKYGTDPTIVTRLTTRILQIFMSSRDSHEALLMRIIDGIGCVTDQTNINNFLVMSYSQLNIEGVVIRPSDRTRLFRSIATGSYLGTKMALELILNNYLEVENRFDSLEGAVQGLSSYVVSDEVLEVMETILSVHSGRMTPSILNTFQNEIASAKRNVAWVNHFKGRINTWLEQNVVLPGDSGHQLQAISAITMIFITLLVLKFIN